MQSFVFLLKSLLVLAFFAGLFYLVFFLLKISPMQKNMQNRRMRILEQLFLSPGVILYLVQIDEKECLVSLSNKAINNIQFIEKKDFKEVLNKVKASKENLKK